jgi:hypothetical protein
MEATNHESDCWQKNGQRPDERNNSKAAENSGSTDYTLYHPDADPNECSEQVEVPEGWPSGPPAEDSVIFEPGTNCLAKCHVRSFELHWEQFPELTAFINVHNEECI